MKCPNCDGILVPGETVFRKNASDFVVHGFGSVNLKMNTVDGEDLLLLDASEKSAAQFCRECGVVVIATEKGRHSAVRKTKNE